MTRLLLVLIVIGFACSSAKAWDPEAPITVLTNQTWSGSWFFITCYFRFELHTDTSGIMYLSDEFGNSAQSSITVLAANRFIDDDNQDFTLIPTASGFSLESTHLPPLNLKPIDNLPVQPTSSPLVIFGPMLLSAILLVWVWRQRVPAGPKQLSADAGLEDKD